MHPTSVFLFIAQSPGTVEEILDRENKRMADSLASKVTRLKSLALDIDRDTEDQNRYLDGMVRACIVRECHQLCPVPPAVWAPAYPAAPTRGPWKHRSHVTKSDCSLRTRTSQA